MLIILASCNNFNEFDKTLSKYLETSSDEARTTFQEMYTFETADKEGRAYCNQLASGKTREEIVSKYDNDLALLVLQKKITIDKSAAMGLVKTYVELAGNIAYCPQYK